VTGTIRVFRSEWFRFLRYRTTWVSTAFLLLVPALFVFSTHVADLAEAARRASVGRAAVETVESGDAWAPFVDAWKAGLVLSTLLLLIHSARSLAGDCDRGVLRLAVTRSTTRGDLVWGRALLSIGLVLGAVFTSGLGAYAVAEYYYDFGPLIDDGYEIMSKEELFAELELAIVSALPALFATYCFGLLLSSLMRSATGAVATALALFLVFDLFKDILGDGQYWVFAAFAPSFVDTSAMKEMAGIARGFSDAMFEPFSQSLVLPLPEALLMLVCSSWVLSRKTL